MRVRPFQPADIPVIKSLFSAHPLPYDFPSLEGPRVESVVVVESDAGEFLMAAAAERILQLYLWSVEMPPHAKIYAIRLLHQTMARELRAKGYNEANAFLPPSMAAQFGRRLERTFQWVKNWPSWAIRF
jgi:hypothetical protein